MKGTLSLFVENLTNDFSNSYEFKGDEYLKALQSYEPVDFNNMMGVECYTTKITNQTPQNEEYREVFCTCYVLDELGVTDLSIDEIINMVYSDSSLKKITLMVDYEEMDMEFEDDFILWVGDSERLLTQAVEIFGDSLLPMKNLYFEFLNKKNETVKLLFENSIILKRDKNKVTIGSKNIKLINVK